MRKAYQDILLSAMIEMGVQVTPTSAVTPWRTTPKVPRRSEVEGSEGFWRLWQHWASPVSQSLVVVDPVEVEGSVVGSWRRSKGVATARQERTRVTKGIVSCILSCVSALERKLKIVRVKISG